MLCLGHCGEAWLVEGPSGSEACNGMMHSFIWQTRPYAARGTGRDLIRWNCLHAWCQSTSWSWPSWQTTDKDSVSTRPQIDPPRTRQHPHPHAPSCSSSLHSRLTSLAILTSHLAQQRHPEQPPDIPETYDDIPCSTLASGRSKHMHFVMIACTA